MSMLTIYLRKADGHGEQIHVDSNLSLKKLLAKVQTIFSVNSSENVQFDLIHRGTVLDSKANDSLQLAGIGNNSIIHIASREQPLPERITLRIIIEDKAYQFVLNKLETVEKLKSEVARELNLPESSITLSYMGLEMDDRQTLETHRLVEGALISANASIGDLALFTQNDRCRASLKTLR